MSAREPQTSHTEYSVEAFLVLATGPLAYFFSAQKGSAFFSDGLRQSQTPNNCLADLYKPG